MSDEWLRPRRARDAFPPYELAEEGLVARAEKHTERLARIYHKAHEQAWNGRATLAALVAEHGGIRVAEDKKSALGKIGSVLLWGELAAWSVSAELALELEDTSAKMAASSQVFDEARHFYVLRDYLWQAGVPLPRLGGYSRKLLVDLLDTDNLLYKLVGMQLLVENAAVVLFKMIAAARIEPVLTDLLYYFERDEARHVGLGALALPRILSELDELEAARLWWFQIRLSLLMLAGGMTMRESFATLGVDQAAMQMHSFKLQAEVFRRMHGAAEDGGPKRRSRATRGLFAISRTRQERLNAFLFPQRPAAELPLWQSMALQALIGAAKRGDRWLAS